MSEVREDTCDAGYCERIECVCVCVCVCVYRELVGFCCWDAISVGLFMAVMSSGRVLGWVCH